MLSRDSVLIVNPFYLKRHLVPVITPYLKELLSTPEGRQAFADSVREFQARGLIPRTYTGAWATATKGLSG
jgi:hypothetical protein